MENIHEYVKQRCGVIHESMMLQWKSTIGCPAPIQGAEREIFIANLLSIMIPPNHRIGSGVIVDSYGQKSRQTDIVVECPYGVRFPIGTGNTSLFVAESVAFTIEVKSHFSKQWPDLIKIIGESYSVKRRRKKGYRGEYGEGSVVDTQSISPPLFIVAYSGPRDLETIHRRMRDDLPRGQQPAGILIIESGLYIGRSPIGHTDATGPAESIFAFMRDVSEWMRFDVSDSWDLGHYLELPQSSPTS